MTSLESLNRHHFWGKRNPAAQLQLQLSSIERHGPGDLRQKGNLAPGQYKMDRGMGGWGWVGMRWSGGRVSGKNRGREGIEGGEGMGICSFVEALVKEKKQFNGTKMKLTLTGPR